MINQDCSKFVQGQVWFADFEDMKREKGVSDKSRPVLIISNNEMNNNQASVTVLPISSSENSLKYHSVSLDGLKKQSYVMINQARCVTKERLKSYITTVNPNKFNQIIGQYNQHVLSSTNNNYKQPKKVNTNNNGGKILGFNTFKQDMTKMPLSKLASKYNMKEHEAKKRILQEIKKS